MVNMLLERWARLGWTRRRCWCLVAALLLCAPTESAALDPSRALDRYTITNWAEDAGPFPFGVYAIAQDHDGYLWLGTREGLVRFDGNTFTNWSDSVQLPDDRISSIVVARDGTLWVGFGTTGGVSHIVNGQARHFDMRDDLQSDDVNALLEDGDGGIWAATFGGCSRFANGSWQRIGVEAGLPASDCLGLFEDSKQNMWVGTSGGVYRRAANERQFHRVTSAAVSSFAEDSSGRIWITDREKAFAILQPGTAQPVLDLSKHVGALGQRIWYDKDGSLWIGTRGSGVFRVRDAAQQRNPVAAEMLSRRDGLATNEIRCLFEDRDGTLWVGTRMGLTRLKDSNIVTTQTDNDAFVVSVISDRDGLWIGTSKGVQYRSSRGGTKAYGVREGLPGQVVTAMHRDAQGTLWVATTRGLARFTGRDFVTLEGQREIVLENVQSMAADPNGSLWICDQMKGLYRWRKGTLSAVTPGVPGPPYVSFADSSGKLWVGLWTSGINVYDSDKVTSYTVHDGLPPGTVNVIHQDRGGAIWVGTAKGLVRFDHGRFVSFSRNGLPASAVVSIVEDTQDNLWVGLALGLLRISRTEFDAVDRNPNASLHYKLFGTDEGLPGTLGRPGMPSSARDAAGDLWFVTSAGLASINPRRLHTAPLPGPMRIDTVIANGVNVPVGTAINLPPGTSRVQITYSVLSLAAVAKLRFRYRLDNVDADWQDSGDRRQASYAGLSPGNYRFRVQTSNNDGGWLDSGALLDFSVRAAFYQTIAFRVVVLVGAALTFWAAWRFRVRSIQQRFTLVLAERARMAREIHDTLLQSLVGVALEFDDISEQLDSSAVALRQQVKDDRDRVEGYIREARSSIHNLRSSALESNDLPTALRSAGEAAVAGANVRFEFVLSGTPRRTAERLEDELLRIGQEAIHNAIRHGKPEAIRTELTYSRQRVRLTVTDDGQGFDPTQLASSAGTHWGLISMRERAQQIGARFLLFSSPGAGTKIEVTARLAIIRVHP